jgi:transposase-like protein
MNGQKKLRIRNLPRLFRQEIIQDYLSGRKTMPMLSLEHGIANATIRKMVYRYKKNNSSILAESISTPIMGSKKKNLSEALTLQLENEELKRQLKLAQLKLEGYQVMGSILEEEYGIDLLKKSEAKQSSGSKKHTQE